MGIPLAGIRVLDLTRAGVGPTSTQRLAFLGAEVIKIESRRHVDMARTVMRMESGAPDYSRVGDDLNASQTFVEFNLDKKSVTIDFWQPEGAALVRRLAAGADAVVSAMR